MGAPRAIALCRCFNGALEFQAGHWQEAEAELRESIRLYREIGAASGEALAWQRLGVLQTARGRLKDGLDSYSEGMLAAERAVMRAHCQTRLYASLTHNRLMAGEVESARQYLELGLEASRRHGHCATCSALLLPAAVGVAIARQDFRQAEAFCQRLDQAAGEYSSRMWVAMARQARGELAAARGELDLALACYEEAYQAYREVGHGYELARCLEAMARLRRARNAPEDAALAESLGSQALRVRARLETGEGVPA